MVFDSHNDNLRRFVYRCLCAFPYVSHVPCNYFLMQNRDIEHYRDLIAASTIHTLNAALCEYHRRECPPSDQLGQVCSQVEKDYQDMKQAVRDMDRKMSCTDLNVSVQGGWAGVWVSGRG